MCRRSPPFASAVPLAALALLVACSREAPRRVDEARLSPEQNAQAGRGREARDALAAGLFAELVAALGKGGPTGAIPVCKDRAPEIARAVGREKGVRIGRTSFRLRNPANEPPPWAAPILDERPAGPVHVELEGGSLGILFPIVTAAPCVQCHGPSERIAPEVREALRASYPRDAATGFSEGDLRGWFWVEVRRA
jgi:hypothetical protein